MKIDAASLPHHLQKSLACCYLIHGDETLLVDDACTAIRRVAEKKGYSNRQRFDVTPHFDCQQLHCALENHSLFGDKTLIELHIGNSTLAEPLKQLLGDYRSNASTCLLICCSKLSASQTKSRWYKQIDRIGVTIAIWPPHRQQLPALITQRLNQAGFTTSSTAIDLIAKQSEGNLLAIRQLAEKLTLLYPPGQLTVSQIEPVLHNQPHFEVFALTEEALRGEKTRCYTILQQLQQQGSDSLFVLGILSRDLRLLLTLHHGGTIPVWSSRKALYQRALSRLSVTLLHTLLQQAASIDRMIKGGDSGNVWDHLTMLTLQLATGRRIELPS